MNYEKLGLRVGLEIHQRIDTHKLFCKCKSSLEDEALGDEVSRMQRLAASEMGEIDPAALFEYLRGRRFVYKIFKGSSCLVELDEEPIHEINKEALRVALQAALLMHADIPNELHIMRKTVIDGSNTSGFQRTLIVGLNGYIEFNGRRIGIKTICLEEESAGIVKKKGKEVIYRIDRLGIPLIEVATDVLEGYTPEEVQEIAYKIGMLLRSLKVMRGIGSIRQDLNVSVEGGARIEIKGVQELKDIAEIIGREVQRQISLINLRDKLKKRICKKDFENFEIKDVTEIFRETGCKFIAELINKKNLKVFAIKLPGFKDLLKMEICKGKTLGKEFADYARAYGVGGIIHSDEANKYHLDKEFRRLEEIFNAGGNDAIVITLSDKNTAEKALGAVFERAKQALDGVPEETRVANPDCTTSYTRPLPGAGRMYPETDLPPIVITRDFLEEIKKSLPEPLEDRVRKISKEYGVEENIVYDLFRLGYEDVFNNIVKLGVEPRFAAIALTSKVREMKREGIDVSCLSTVHFVKVFELYKRGKLGRQNVVEILKEIAKKPQDFEKIVRNAEKMFSLEEIERIVDNVVRNNENLIRKLKERAFKPIMGEIMKEYRGRVDAAKVAEILKRKIEDYAGK